MTLLIRDGYTLSDTIAGVGQFPAVTFKYRPALYAAFAEYMADKGDQTKAMAKALKAHVVEWNVKNGTGGIEPLTEENLALLPGRVAALMLDKVMGYGAPAANGESHEWKDAKN